MPGAILRRGGGLGGSQRLNTAVDLHLSCVLRDRGSDEAPYTTGGEVMDDLTIKKMWKRSCSMSPCWMPRPSRWR
jgi:hypothetical protein